MSKTITLAISDQTFDLMKRFPEVNFSELARQKINEYLANLNDKKSPESVEFLVLKDLIFVPQRIKEIHSLVEKNKKQMNELFWVEAVFDLDLFESLARFLKEFARIHPFEDGNKRTAFVCIDAFLRLNRMKLKIEQSSKKTTDDEKFFWQNANKQKTQKQIIEFLKEHMMESRKPKSVEQAINDSIEENKILLKNLAQ
ncbi:MAG: Fic family protein [archaeon]|nr:Fic family protein [archaeon]